MAKIEYSELSGKLKSIIEEHDAICVLGPTASGKTRFATTLAGEIGKIYPGRKAEILSADSRQVYKGMDIGTGKDLDEYTTFADGKASAIPYHLIDIAEAGEKYNIFQYQRDFSKAYISVKERGNFPLICGGSGLYIEAATRGYRLADVSPDHDRRAELEKKSMDELMSLLTELKARKGCKPHNSTDFDTKKRAIRAIEIEEAASVPDNELPPLPGKVYYIGIDVDREVRNKRIDDRLEKRLKEGMTDEIKRLLGNGIPSQDLIYYGLEYKFVTQYVIGEMEYDEMVEKLKIAIHQFAKRQMTWFRGMERKGIEINWIKL